MATDRTPAQVAEDARREAHRQVLVCAARAWMMPDGVQQQGALDPAHAAIDRAVLEAVVAQAENMVRLLKQSHHAGGAALWLAEQERDRLRAELAALGGRT